MIHLRFPCGDQKSHSRNGCHRGGEGDSAHHTTVVDELPALCQPRRRLHANGNNADILRSSLVDFRYQRHNPFYTQDPYHTNGVQAENP